MIYQSSTFNPYRVYGYAEDGDVTISANTTLTKDMFYRNLTIDNGFTLTTDAYRIFVFETLTNNGTIDASGSNGSPGTALAGGGGGSSKVSHSVAVGGTGGAGGTRSPAIAAVAGTSVSGGGGNGGAGGSGSAAGGTVTTILNRQIDYDHLGVFSVSTAVYLFGGAGGGGGAAPPAPENGAGGGGQGGGVLWVAARILAGNGLFKADGGNGGNSQNTVGRGGGGGGGGFIWIITDSTSVGSLTFSVAGGTNADSGATGSTGDGKMLNRVTRVTTDIA